jgi:hypothetical protein
LIPRGAAGEFDTVAGAAALRAVSGELPASTPPAGRAVIVVTAGGAEGGGVATDTGSTEGSVAGLGDTGTAAGIAGTGNGAASCALLTGRLMPSSGS